MAVDFNGLTIGVVSLGCAKNLVDTELMLGLLTEKGAQITDLPAEADVLLVNTCAFIGPAKEESIDTILELARYKEEGRCRALIVAGCLSQRYRDELLTEMPEVDAILGVGDIGRVPEIVSRALQGDKWKSVSQAAYTFQEEVPRVLTTSGHFAYVKIAEGCNHPCSFCVIPQIRGRYKSRPIEPIVAEVESLVEQGVREVILIAQDTTRYGFDLYGQNMLAPLLRRLNGISQLKWIRLLYTYPTSFTDELIGAIAELEKVVKYIDLPLQHADDEILAAMQRQGRRRDLLRLIDRLRSKIPEVVLRSSFIVGFPGETNEQFQSLLSFLREVEFDHVGIFRYSPEEGTKAAQLSDQISDKVKEERYQEAMTVQQDISRKKNRQRIGDEYQIVVDGFSPESDLVMVGRTSFQAPEIDGVTYFANKVLSPGTFATVRISEAHEYDLVGEIVRVGEETK